MAGAPRGQKRKRIESSSTSKRSRSDRLSIGESPAQTATSLGGVSVFKGVWRALAKAGWTSKRPTSRSLDSRYKYIRPGGRHDGEEGVDFLLGELDVLRYIKDTHNLEATGDEAVQSTDGVGDTNTTTSVGALVEVSCQQLVRTGPSASAPRHGLDDQRFEKTQTGGGLGDQAAISSNLDGVAVSGDLSAAVAVVTGRGGRVARGGRTNGRGAREWYSGRGERVTHSFEDMTIGGAGRVLDDGDNSDVVHSVGGQEAQGRGGRGSHSRREGRVARTCSPEDVASCDGEIAASGDNIAKRAGCAAIRADNSDAVVCGLTGCGIRGRSACGKHGGRAASSSSTEGVERVNDGAFVNHELQRRGAHGGRGGQTISSTRAHGTATDSEGLVSDEGIAVIIDNAGVRGSRGRGVHGRRGGHDGRGRKAASTFSAGGVSVGCGNGSDSAVSVGEVTARGARGRGECGRRGGRGGRAARTAGGGRHSGGGRGDARANLESPDLTPSGATSTPSRTPPIMLQDVYVSKLVAFSPDKERWMKAKAYRPIGSAYIIGRVYRQVKKGKNASLFQIRWLDTQFQGVVEHISIGFVQLGIKNYIGLTRVNNPDWRELVQPDPTDVIEVEADAFNFEEEEVPVVYDPAAILPTSLAEVEAIQSMRFIPSGRVEAPSYLYQHTDGSTTTYVREEFKHLFEHSATSSFFAYIPLYFWRQVLHETNKYAVVNDIRMTVPFTLEELMKFLGILFFMAMTDKGEYANYWGPQTEDFIFGGVTTSLDVIMTLHRFKLLRRCLSFNATPTALENDAAARIRPLLNLLKITGGQYVCVGRDVALDEASVACRSRQGRHMIVYNPMKPTGKYHFRLYMVCCSTSWIAINYKLHCRRSDIVDRLRGVIDQAEAQDLKEELEEVSKIRQHVLEVTRPLFGTNRIINMDNYYTSVQLLQELRLKGLYGRGTVRANSKHYPAHTILDKGDCMRGDYRQAVSHDHSMLAVSWCDGNVVNMVSNADSTNITTVNRMVGSEHQSYPAPECVAQYNANMQGVDRLDQIRGRFSVSDGHSYKRWHKKLALALIDVARSNAYLTRRLVKQQTADRDPHRKFMMELVAELLNGQWVNAPSDGQMLYSGAHLEEPEEAQAGTPSSRQHQPDVAVPATVCGSVSSKQMYTDKNRKRRRCIVCRWEGRYPTEVTTYCLTHGVCLCQTLHNGPAKPWMCPSTASTCWDKFHQFYYPNGLFTDKGNVRRNSKLAKLKKTTDGRPQAEQPRTVRQIAFSTSGAPHLGGCHNPEPAAEGSHGLAEFELDSYHGRGDVARKPSGPGLGLYGTEHGAASAAHDVGDGGGEIDRLGDAAADGHAIASQRLTSGLDCTTARITGGGVSRFGATATDALCSVGRERAGDGGGEANRLEVAAIHEHGNVAREIAGAGHGLGSVANRFTGGRCSRLGTTVVDEHGGTVHWLGDDCEDGRSGGATAKGLDGAMNAVIGSGLSINGLGAGDTNERGN